MKPLTEATHDILGNSKKSKSLDDLQDMVEKREIHLKEAVSAPQAVKDLKTSLKGKQPATIRGRPPKYKKPPLAPSIGRTQRNTGQLRIASSPSEILAHRYFENPKEAYGKPAAKKKKA